MSSDDYNFVLTEQSYVEAAWFVAGDAMDWMAMVYRDAADAPWKARYRFRYHHPDTVGIAPHPGDRFSIYDMVPKGADDPDARLRMVGAMDAVAFSLASQWRSQAHRVLVQGDQEEFFRKWSQMPFVHERVELYAPGPLRPQ